MSSKRRKAREIALQVLYGIAISPTDWEASLAESVERRRSSPEAAEYARSIIQRVVEHMEDLDQRISARLENWEFRRVALIDRTILRIALAELLFLPETPTNVIINEAIEIAHIYSSKDAGRFVNGILDSLAAEVRRI
jgi:N utilization substance protein B